jgi:hypothetical protein
MKPHPPTNTAGPEGPSKADTAPCSDPDGPTRPPQDGSAQLAQTPDEAAIFAEFPEHHAWVTQQMAKIQRLEPEPLDTATTARKLQDTKKFLEEQRRLMQENAEWLEERSHWANPAPPTTENAVPAPSSAEDAEA